MSDIQCPWCETWETGVETRGWGTKSGPYSCAKCGKKFTISVDSFFDGESSYPVYTLEPQP